MSKKKEETNICPGCGKKCLSMRWFNDIDFIAEHEFGIVTARSAGSGLMITFNSLLDGCTPAGKIGRKHLKIAEASQEEEF